MFDNLGLHTEYLTPLSVALLIAGGVLGYGSRFLVKKICKNPSDKLVVILKIGRAHV